MITWYWLIVAFCVGIIFSTFANGLFDWDNTLAAILAWIILAVMFIPRWIYYAFFELTIFHPILKSQFEKVTSVYTTNRTVKHLFGNLYSWHDLKAKSILHRWFLVRVKEK